MKGKPEAKIKLQLKIKVGDKEVTLDAKEAENLYVELQKIFGKEKEYIPYPIITNPITYPYNPIWVTNQSEDWHTIYGTSSVTLSVDKNYQLS